VIPRFTAPIVDALDEGFASWLITHEKYVHPKMVLEDDNIFVMGCDSKYIWFSVTPPEV